MDAVPGLRFSTPSLNVVCFDAAGTLASRRRSRRDQAGRPDGVGAAGATGPNWVPRHGRGPDRAEQAQTWCRRATGQQVRPGDEHGCEAPRAVPATGPALAQQGVPVPGRPGRTGTDEIDAGPTGATGATSTVAGRTAWINRSRQVLARCRSATVCRRVDRQHGRDNGRNRCDGTVLAGPTGATGANWRR